MNRKKIVNTNINYTYEILQENLKELKKRYSFLEIGQIGKSVLNKTIPYIKIGVGKKEVFYSASYHANEWITSVILMSFIEDYANAYSENKKIMGYEIKKLYENVSIYIVPMVNPDGVDLVTCGLKYVDNVDNILAKIKKIANNFPSIPFPSGWKSNINGVDLNLQFPACWERAKRIKYMHGFNKPAPRDYVGSNELSEPEALSVYNFTMKHDFRLVIAFHSQGKEIYCDFQNIKPIDGELIGEIFSKESGYELAKVAYNSSFAGYKDWFIQNFNRPRIYSRSWNWRKSVTY